VTGKLIIKFGHIRGLMTPKDVTARHTLLTAILWR